jgi:very-short-patch-repair endonuclease
MRGESSTQFADRVIRRVAGRQHGTVSRHQLLAAGISPRQIELRLTTGRFVGIHRGVYLAGAVAAAHTHEMAALIAYDRNAVLSHRSAAALWNLLPYPAAAPVWVTVRPQRSASRPRIKAIRAHLHRRDIRRRHGMPLTSPPRTILDLAGHLNEYDLEGLVAEANYRRLASEAELRSQLDRNPSKPGVVALRGVLDVPGGPQRTRSPAERLLLRLLRDAGITGFELNARVHGYEVDALWRDLAFAIEVDGYDGHSGRIAFERDRRKLAVLVANGLTVMPITPRQLSRVPDEIAARLQLGLVQAARARAA